MEEFKFVTVGQALSFFTRQIPTRAKPLNIIEPDSCGSRIDTEDTWIRLAGAIHRTVRSYDNESKRVFTLRYGFSGDRNKQLDFAEIDTELGLRNGRARKVIRKILDELEQALVAVDLLDPPIE